ncbi:dihydromonapterin reductase [Maribrevibacterium harenarium]|uniref:Dihydromonapterin reductase n=1 Tax=Maribrevibacterium harenarium TaxID=2589817 RepID=A0A501WGZ3_9GAMM|nr:dihydromonapterin reductase [Maribrevibacterium harenarium]TPE47755.1 dihydromonapterin reductase [Maribrevibacterium harenarium]
MRTTCPIIVTGGAQRLGLAITKFLYDQHIPVVVTYRRPKPSVDALIAAGVRCLRVDFSHTNSVTEFIATIKQDYGALRGIIHNASEWQAEEDADDISKLMECMWSVHVATPYRINSELEPLLKAGAELLQEQTDIIHVTDYVAERGSDKHIAYAASKAGLANLTLSFAKKLAPQVKVNTIAPSLLMFKPDDDENYRQKALSKSLLQIEPGEQEGVAAVQYLLNSRYMTGRTIALDGGRHLAK